MENKIRLICLDLDGTLLNSKSEISKPNNNCLKQCLDQGIHVFFVTGRPYCYARYLANQIDERIEIVSYNGGCYIENNQLIEKFIPQDKLIPIINAIEKYKIPAFFKGSKYFYTHEEYDKRFLYDHMTNLKGFPFTQSFSSLTWDELRHTTKDIIKVLLYNYDVEPLNQLRAEIDQIDGVTTTSDRTISFDIIPENVSKGNALSDIMKTYGIKKEEVISFGDAENDIPMFERSGFTVAMGNAKESIKEMCDDVTLSNDEDGIAYYLNKFIL